MRRRIVAVPVAPPTARVARAPRARTMAGVVLASLAARPMRAGAPAPLAIGKRDPFKFALDTKEIL